ncbi:hypothetical protein [Sphingomonas sp.]|uniref:hypothetical protein n=1 Tax=Sphingomonas sp. TaxID=28214 RepID=UPI001EB89677|nr:hypothetical protein [Sphingomonas sp.]MBX3594680.1 hypothetical protein [Sphingomonas sp.]
MRRAGVAAGLALALLAPPATASRLLGPFEVRFDPGTARPAAGEAARLAAGLRDVVRFGRPGAVAYLCAPGEAGRGDGRALKRRRVATVRAMLATGGVRAARYDPEKCAEIEGQERAYDRVTVRIWPEWVG